MKEIEDDTKKPNDIPSSRTGRVNVEMAILPKAIYRFTIISIKMTNLDSMLKNRDTTLLTKVHIVKARLFQYGCELDHKESWALNNWWFWPVVLEKTLESPLDSKAMKPLNPKGNQSWMFIGRTEAEAEAPILWLPDLKNWLTGKDSDVGKDWRQEKKGMAEDEMVRWDHWLDGHEFEKAPGVGEGQGRSPGFILL